MRVLRDGRRARMVWERREERQEGQYRAGVAIVVVRRCIGVGMDDGEVQGGCALNVRGKTPRLSEVSPFQLDFSAS